MMMYWLSSFLLFYGLNDYTQAQEGRVIAINEGRLVDFLSMRPELRVLQDNIEEYFYKEGHAELLPGFDGDKLEPSLCNSSRC